jgi:RHS repeat-associated protein
LGSTAITANSGGTAEVGELRYYPYGKTRYTSGTTPTKRRFTGQIEDAYIKLYNMGVRWYDPEIGRWIQPDTIIPDPANPQSLNRYSYVYNRPLAYVDDSGHIPIIPILIGIVVIGSKVVDYGLTAYDAYQSGRVLGDPNASRGDKLLAGLNVGMSVAFEALEPDDALPVGLPLDDMGRRALMKGAREAFEEGGEEAVERFIRDTLGDQADDVLERMFKEVGGEAGEKAAERVLVDGMQMSTDDALDAAAGFLGEGYRDMSNGRYLSVDGLRQVRMTNGDILGTHGGGPHLNFETLAPVSGRSGRFQIVENLHIYMVDP